MTLDVVVLSAETIKPSLPTPKHLKTFKLSLLDQYSPLFGVPVILFFSSEGDYGRFVNTNMSDKLKTSFSQALSQFYPLTGKVMNNYFIDCDDSGVEYLETQVNCRLDQVLDCPKAEELNQLLPVKLNSFGMNPETQLEIQVNIFQCGGMAIGSRISHKVADAATLCAFINTWASIARGGAMIVSPQFDSAALYPTKEVVSPFKPPKAGGLQQRVVTKRFVFHPSKIASLKAKSVNKSFVENPTRVEVVSALLWKCLMNASISSPRSIIKPFMMNIAVNLRTRMVPPLPDHSFGNLILGAMPSSEREAGLHCLVGKLRKAIKKIDSNYLNNLKYNDGISMFHDSLRQLHELSVKEEIGFYTITSWCRFPFYEADFGWGKPIWATPLSVAHKNLVVLMDTKCGKGIEAMVSLDDEEMAIFESDQELLAFASENRLLEN
ncbi:Salutaridinol 7-o-acetyltransferase [Thalictrum thalictroides]|uniref:Salutaridinol 7-o-acetyltransferase n=1 Tax=Thalictrum thalictroides TaxID=46969 RepID=A0A7J6WW58_THATH|nr:Salutaridinol 7-o-acetyltransferase [Thalictrum thalictroides]